MDPGGDPGWRSALRYALYALVPGWSLRLRKRSGDSDGLVLLRGIFLSFTTALLLVGVVVVVLESAEGLGGTVSDTPASVGIALMGLASLAGSRLERPLPCGDDARLAKSYTQRFFLRLALAEAAALAGFVAFVLTGSGWMYPLGLLFTAIGFAQLAPTTKNLEEDEERLRVSGCARSLVDALRRNPPGGRLSPR
jgi:peptidoglycan/LPS O-acetylase OafA/YrhL